jgi:hypothetical protein
MTGACNFVADLARAGKGYQEIKVMVDAAYGDQSLQKTAIYAIIKKVKAGESTADMRHLNPKKNVRTPELIASVTAAVEEDRCLSMEISPPPMGYPKNDLQHPAPGSRPRKEVGQMGA